MYCMHCGKELPDGAKYCIYCGGEQMMIPEQLRHTQTPVTGPLPMEGERRDQDPVTGPLPMTGEQHAPAPVDAPVFVPEKKETYVPKYAPKPMEEDMSHVVFRGGYERSVEKLMNIGVELSGIAILFLFIRLILSAFIRSYTMARSDIYLSFLALAFLLAACVVNTQNGKRLWLGAIPLILTAIDYFLMIREVNEINPKEDFGYDVGWSKYGISLILFVVYFAVYLWMTYQRTKDNRAGAVVLAVISMAALVLFMVQTTNMVSEDIKDESNVEIWYDMFTGLHIICFHIIYFCFALRGILAKKEEPET